MIALAAVLAASVLSQTIQVQLKSSDQTNSTTSYADVSDLTFEVGASSTYVAQWILVASSAAGTTGIQLAVNGPASPAEVTATITCFSAAGTPSTLNVNAYDTGLDLTDSAGSTRVQCSIRMTLRNGANAGVVAARVKSEVGASAITIHAGSSVVYHTP